MLRMKTKALHIYFASLLATLAVCSSARPSFAVDATNVFYGNAGNSSLTGMDNSGFGYTALESLTYGSGNTGIGYVALQSNTSGIYNTGIGFFALQANTSGGYNTAVGYATIDSNTTGSSNTAIGSATLNRNTTGNYNSAAGYYALYYNTSGTGNVGNGFDSLYNNTTGSYNMGQGPQALYANTIGSANCAIGVNALVANTTGSNNIGIGPNAGLKLTTGSNNIDIGNQGVAAESNTIRIGTSQTQAYMAGVHGATVSGGMPVYVSSNGQLGVAPSSKRFKDDVKPMDKQSEALLSLKPVTFRYKKELDPNKTAQFGLVAEDVAKVDPDLVARDDKGQIYSVRYEAVNAMLLNEFLKEHREVQELRSRDARKESLLAQQAEHSKRQDEMIAALAAALKKQSAKIEQVKAEAALSASTKVVRFP